MSDVDVYDNRLVGIRHAARSIIPSDKRSIAPLHSTHTINFTTNALCALILLSNFYSARLTTTQRHAKPH